MEPSKTNDTNLSLKDYAEISIIGDGNCFFRCLSQYFDNTQEYYDFYRQLVFNYIMDNKQTLKDFSPMFPSRSFIDLELVFMSVTHLGLIFVYDLFLCTRASCVEGRFFTD